MRGKVKKEKLNRACPHLQVKHREYSDIMMYETNKKVDTSRSMSLEVDL